MQHFKTAFAAIALLSSATLARPAAAETNWFHRGNLFSVCVLGHCAGLDHTWAETNGVVLGHSSDMTQNFDASTDYCVAYNAGTSFCASHRRPVTQQWAYNQTVPTITALVAIGNSYIHSGPGIWGFNGVCHQATNRAFFRTNAPWVENMPVGGNQFSHGIFGYCGANHPWGSPLACP